MLLKTTLLKDYKQELFQLQSGRCALTGLSLTDFNSSHLDHDHELDGNKAGRCRGLLHPLVNVLEGRIKHQFNRSGLKGEINYIEFLKYLTNYLQQDYTENPIHPRFITDSAQRFSRLTVKEMKSQLLDFGLDCSGTRAVLIKKYKKYLRQTHENSREIIA
ncbi:endonuclease domain-containing protein [Pantoea sp. MBLJ3]|uniref:endonuclease domain-containing protein n=1 Tax=Pantoea sp. MBLJ3 TaxID=1562889 RepID=UPI00057C9ABF|nr:endonuclease domain-containing protein [Pantoea sp. MBLJ3]